MDIKVTVAIIAGVFGLLGGVVGSLIAPWVQWGIEKRRFRLNRHLEYIKDWRRFIASNEFNHAKFRDTKTYVTIRPHLSKDSVDAIEGKSVHVSLTGSDPIRSRLLNEVTKIEKKWGLV
jgi:hypothetical protein